MSDGLRLVLFFVIMLSAMYIPTTPVPVWCDNESAIRLSQQNVFFGRSKHILIRYLHGREMMAAKIVEIFKIKGTDNLADQLTKTAGQTLANAEKLRSRYLAATVDYSERSAAKVTAAKEMK